MAELKFEREKRLWPAHDSIRDTILQSEERGLHYHGGSQILSQDA